MRSENISEKLAVAANQNVKEGNFWLNKLSGERVKSCFPYDNKGVGVTGVSRRRIDSEKFTISGELFSQLRRLSNRNDHTLHMILAAGIVLLLSKYSGNNDVIVGTTIYKQDIETEFINTVLSLISQLNPRERFKTLLLRVRETIIEAIKNYRYPLEVLLDKLNIPFSDDEFGLFDVAFLLENIQQKEYIRHLKINVVFSFLRRDECIDAAVEYNSELYKPQTIERIFTHFTRLLGKALSDVNITVSAIDILSDEEKQQLLVDFNNTEMRYPKDKMIHRLVEEQVEKNPDKIAVVFKEKELTYRELNIRANRLAHLLRKKGVKPGIIVGVMVDRSPEMVTALLAVLKAGGAYLPIDSKYPQKRILAMLNDSGAKILMTKEGVIGDVSFTRFQDFFPFKKEPKITPQRSQIKDFDRLLIPDRTLIDYQEYHKHIGQGMVRDSITIQATRGCPFHCAYCHRIWPRTHVVRSAENLFNEVKLYYDLGIRRFVFVDDIFNLDKENSTRFFELIIKHGLKVHFHNPNGLRGDLMNREYIDLMVEAGTVNIALALETASPRLQKMIGKNLSIEKVCENLQYIIDKYPHVTLELQTMHGFPTETEEEAKKTLDLIKSFKWIDIPYVHLLKIYPNTDMVRLALENGISAEAIDRAADTAFHEYSETIPFSRSFTTRYQAILMNEYFLSKERLLAVLPRQMKILKEDELIQKYNSYLPLQITTFKDLLDLAGISRDELGQAKFLSENFGKVPDFNEKVRRYFPLKKPKPDALKVLLLDLSMTFMSENLPIYDIADTPLGLMYLLTYLNQQFGDLINGRIAKARIDFDSFEELRILLEEFKPDVIGMRTLTYFRNFFHKTVSLVRQWGIDTPVIAGGPYATSDYITLLKDSNIDIVVRGEGELTFAEIIEKMIKNGGKLPGEQILEQIHGISYMKEDDRKYLKENSREIMMLDHIQDKLWANPEENLENINNSSDLAYLIYTSGTAGKPKGVMLEHGNLNNLLHFQFAKTNINFSGNVFQFTTISFDVAFQEIFSTLTAGGKLCLIDSESRMDIDEMVAVIEKNKINVLFLPPSFLKSVLAEGDYLRKLPCTLEHIVTAGEQLVVTAETGKYVKENRVYLHNHYGPSETHVVTTLVLDPGEYEYIPELPPIGKPISNTKIYILNEENLLQPVGMVGELCISGDSVGRGYWHKPGLTSQKFVDDPFTPGKRMYRTGDLARWLADGNIEFLGRKDHQVKIRGFRVELGEIESQLLKHPLVKDAVVLPVVNENGDKHLCAYVAAEKQLDLPELTDYLSAELPDYMVPSYFKQLDKIPLNPNGKVDRKYLSTLKMKTAGNHAYTAPADEIEEKLVEIWSDLLGVERSMISTDADFFELGGQSLKATILASKINKVFNVKVRLAEVFNTSTIRGFAKYIKKAAEERFTAITAMPKKEYYPLSSAQKRMYILHQFGKGNDTGYNISDMVNIKGRVKAQHIEEVARLLIKRHEILRTSFELVNEEPVQRIYEDVSFNIEYYDLTRIEEPVESIIENFIRPFDFGKAPLLRVGLIKKTAYEYLLMFDLPHIIIDGTSKGILINEFIRLYNGEELPGLRVQYKDFTSWQNTMLLSGVIKAQEDHWLNVFAGEVPVLNMPTSYPRPSFRSAEGDNVKFEFSHDLSDKIRIIALENSATVYMVLLSIYNILLSKYSGQEDIVVDTPVAGRSHPDLDNLIGMLVNTLAMRNYPKKEKTFKEFLEDVKENSLKAFENQDYQFDDLVNRLNIERDPARQALFDTMFAVHDTRRPQDHDIYDQKISGLTFSRCELHKKTSPFDIALQAWDSGDVITFLLSYWSKIFKREMMELLIHHFITIAEEVAANPGIKISEIEMFSPGDKNQILWISGKDRLKDIEIEFDF